MSFDGLLTHSIINELQSQILDGRVTKIQHPYNQEIILTIRNNRQNYRLLISAHATYARIQITNIPFLNPKNPSNFCMTLRKYLDGAFLTKIEQLSNDRIIFFTFEHRNEIGDLEKINLIVELMGRHSNILLVNHQTNKIIDCIKHISLSQNSYRILLPGSTYTLPPIQKQKLNPFSENNEEIFEFLSINQTFDGKMIQQFFEGFGKDSANELAYLLNQTNQKIQCFKDFINHFSTPSPTLAMKNNKWYLLPFHFQTIAENEETYLTLSSLCDAFYGTKAEEDRVNQQIGDVLHRLKNDKKKALQKLPKLEQTLVNADKAEILRQKGELLTTFLHQVPKGATKVILPNYYLNNNEIEIELNPAYSPSKNAQKYFQKYQKLKNGVHIVEKQVKKTKEDIKYLDTLITELEIATPLELPALQEELAQMGYLKKKKQKNNTKQKNKINPHRYESSDGTLILVGKNNLQNDELTLKVARKDYIWLHTKDIPGSHVIITSNNPSKQTLEEAAILAAYYSKYRNSAKVPVDYVEVKNIHKPNGAKPGFVIYKKQRTLFVTPSKENLEKIKAL